MPSSVTAKIVKQLEKDQVNLPSCLGAVFTVLLLSTPVTEDFQRAVKVCTGYTLGSHVVNTVFQIFDSDGDGHLSHQEFISIMKDRLHRGARVSLCALFFVQRAKGQKKQVHCF